MNSFKGKKKKKRWSELSLKTTAQTLCWDWGHHETKIVPPFRGLTVLTERESSLDNDKAV